MKRKFLRFFELLLVVFLTGTIASCGPKAPTNDSTNSSGQEDPFGCITIAEAIEIATAAGDTETEEFYTVRGVIESIAQPQYGEMTIKDATGSIYVYGINDYSTMNPKPYKGDEVVINGKLKTYKGKAEFGRSNLLEFTPAPEKPFDETEYEAMSIESARNKESGAKVKLTGVVAAITLTQKNVQDGFFLIDKTGSIAIHDADAVQKVKKGNTVTICAERQNYIDSKHQYGATKFGYTGEIQLVNANVRSNDNKTSDFNTTSIQESTIKEMLDTVKTTNITTKIYKVNTIIKKVPDKGFTNYYFNDLDGLTGTYVHSNNNGNDYEWLDPFVDKISTAYLTVLNVKTTNFGFVPRFFPIKVMESTFKFAPKDVPPFVSTYFAETQFDDVYNANPDLEVIETYSNELLEITNATISYTSDNAEVVKFEKVNEKLVMKTLADGTTNINIKVVYGDQVNEIKLPITVKSPDTIANETVKSALAKDDNTEVTVKGIVASGVVNQESGIYLVDETGSVTVRLYDSALTHRLSLGDEIIVTGTKKHKTDKTNLKGQIVIDEAKVVANMRGHHEIPTNSYTVKTIEELAAFNTETDDITNNVYTVKGKVKVISAEYYTNICIASLDETKTIILYASNERAYSWLVDFKDEAEVTFEIALCNWNDKSSYKACVLSVSNGSKTIRNTTNLRA